MLSDYIKKAMTKAHYEIIQDNEPYYGDIPELIGVWASEMSLEKCRQQLIDVLEGWILLRVRKGLEIPVLDEIIVNSPEN